VNRGQAYWAAVAAAIQGGWGSTLRLTLLIAVSNCGLALTLALAARQLT